MMKKKINQKIISQIEFYKMNGLNSILANSPISRFSSKLNFTDNNKKNKLQFLKEEIEKTNNCEFKKAAKNIIFSDGNPDSKIMLIGEISGEKEEERGLPFMGPEGELLDKMLQAINLDRTKVYLTNIINYRFPTSKKLNFEIIEKYIPFLFDHIEIINPKILILLGGVALQSLVGKEGNLFKQRGFWFKKKINNSNPDIIATFHPTFLLEHPEHKKNSWIDLKLVREKIKLMKL